MRTSVLIIFIAVVACRPTAHDISDPERVALTDTVRAFVQGTMNSADSLDFDAYFRNFSDDADAKYAEAGSLYSSLAEMRKGYAELIPNFASLKQGMDGWTAVVLARDAVAFTTPFHFEITMKGRPEYKGSGVWSGVVQRRHGVWRIVQAHESWNNQDQVIAALTAAPAKKAASQQ